MADAQNIPRLKNYYDKEVAANLMKEFSFSNRMEVPRLEKITVNIGLGEAIQNPKAIEAAASDIATITGQKPVVTHAKKSIASFKLREDMPIGVMVTLRRSRMWEFLDRFVNIALPRVRDFRGVAGKLDGSGNYSVGMKEQIVFTEVDYDQVDRLRGMNITFTTTAKNDAHGKALLKHLGMPFRN